MNTKPAKLSSQPSKKTSASTYNLPLNSCIFTLNIYPMKSGVFLQILASTAICVLGITMQVYSQSAVSLLQSAKQEFKKDYTTQNMPQTVLDLKKALALSPNNPEITYHLAYALDRVYTADASWIASSNLTKVEEISKYLEQTIRLSPRYTGE